MQAIESKQNRIADLESRVAVLEREIAARDRQLRSVTPPAMWWVQTVDAGATLSPSYPTWSDQPKEIPIRFLDLGDWLEDGSARSASVQAVLHAPRWLPKGAIVRAVRDRDGKYRLAETPLLKGRVSSAAGIEPDASGDVSIWMNGAETGGTLTAWHDWGHNNVALVQNQRVLLWLFLEQKRYSIIGWACP